MRRQIKDNIYESIAVYTKALSNPKRIEIMELLLQGEKTVELISEQAEVPFKNASAQLKELKIAGFVKSAKVGKYVTYSIADEEVGNFIITLRKFSKEKSNVLQKITQEYLASPNEYLGENRKSIMAKAKKGEVIIIDVRPIDEYVSGHLPFAISVPISELSKKLKTFPKDKEIIAYCRGPYCFLALEAVETLRAKGFKALRLSDSVQDWKSNGLPIEV